MDDLTGESGCAAVLSEVNVGTAETAVDGLLSNWPDVVGEGSGVGSGCGLASLLCFAV